MFTSNGLSAAQSNDLVTGLPYMVQNSMLVSRSVTELRSRQSRWEGVDANDDDGCAL